MEKGIGRNVLIVVGILLAVAIALLYMYAYLLPELTGALTETAIVQHGNVKISSEVKCIVVRDEEVISASDSGSVSYYASEVEKVRKGLGVVDIYSVNGSKSTLYCPQTGFISYYFDGYENMLNSESIKTMDPEKYIDIDVVPILGTKSETEIGEPVYKLITSNTWYMLLIVDNQNIDMYKAGNKVTVYMSETDDIKGTVSLILPGEEKSVVVVKTKRFYKDFAKVRTLNVTVITQDTEGLVVPATAITKIDDEKIGVYVLGIDDEYSLVEVTKLTDFNDNVLVALDEKLKLYDEILRNADEYKH